MKAYELLAKEENWTQGVSARNKDDRQVEAHDAEAVKFCAVGALRRCYDKGRCEHTKKYSLFLAATQKLYPNIVTILEGKIKAEVTVPSINDTGLVTHEMIINILKHADL
jgi:hypothetical protein